MSKLFDFLRVNVTQLAVCLFSRNAQELTVTEQRFIEFDENG
jgi:hypothetical protein